MSRQNQIIETRCQSAGPWKKYWAARKYRTIDFLDVLGLDWSGGFLDIGGENEMGFGLARYFDSSVTFTEGDLDNDWTTEAIGPHKIVTCLEVLEHLLNPLLFLEKLKRFIDKDTTIIISYPHSNSMFLKPTHWHEFYMSEFLYLLKRAGYAYFIYDKQRLNWKYSRYFWAIKLI